MYTRRALEVLRAKGYRITQSRRAVLKALERAEGPLSPYQMQRLLQEQGRRLDHVTIYRTLELLCTNNLAHRLSFQGGFVRCSLDDEEACHRYMVCLHCGSFQEFADETLCKNEEEAVRSFGFQARQHVAESLGLCASCQRSGDVRL